MRPVLILGITFATARIDRLLEDEPQLVVLLRGHGFVPCGNIMHIFLKEINA